jgi:uncharacterized protein (TIRG00374 family)
MSMVSRWWRSPWLRYGLTAALLAFILWKANPSQFWDAAKDVSVGNLALAMALTAPFLILKALRWHVLLRAGRCRATFTEAFISLLGGMGVALLTPARLGEVTRAAYLSEPRKLRVGALVMVDKVYDVIVLALLSVAGAAVLVSPLLALALAVGGLIGVFCALRAPALRTAFSIGKRLPLYAKVDKVLAEFAEFGASVGAVCLLLTLGSFLIVLAQYYVILHAWGQGSLQIVVYCFPMVVLTNAVPLTVAGLGTREGAAVLLLRHYGVKASIAGTSAFLMFFMNTALPGVVGALITPFYKVKAQPVTTPPNVVPAPMPLAPHQ